uniref:Uncharacterized protein n=1 Tax=Timema cristinae TaxID=61476 RepID=A0A7R9H7F5_TIMCR|nr:unnamed protein product [Timema cristinae]
MAETTGNPYDMNGQSFNPDMYFQKLVKNVELPLSKTVQYSNKDISNMTNASKISKPVQPSR